jgi:glucokinase
VNAGEVVAVDLGQTKLAVARVRSDLTIAEVRTVATPDQRDLILSELTAHIRALWGPDVVAIGLASASLVADQTRRLLWSGSLPLEGFAVGPFLERQFGVAVAVENDANAAAVGEHRAGAGMGVNHLILVTVGTAVGGGLILNGSLYRGATGVAGEVGHYTVNSRGPRCVDGCPGWGHLDVLGSGTAIDVEAREAAKRHPESLLGQRLAGGHDVDARLAVELARMGDRVAIATIAKVGRRLGHGLVTLVNVLNPELILVGGGASAAGELLISPMRRVIERRALAPARDVVRVEPARLGAHAGLVGAAALAFDAAAA